MPRARSRRLVREPSRPSTRSGGKPLPFTARCVILPASEIFMHCANTIAAQYAKVPSFATYTVHTKLLLFKKDESFDRRVSVRTADQVAVVFDERTNKDELRAPFPAPPNLEVFRRSGRRCRRSADPRTSLDVYIDKNTDLPIRVTWAADDTTMTADYETVQGYWPLKSLSVRATVFVPLHIGRTTVAFESRFDGHTISEVAPDPRLVPGALPTPSAAASATP